MRVPELITRLQRLPNSHKECLVRFRYVCHDHGTFREDVAKLTIDSTGIVLHGPESTAGNPLDIEECAALAEPKP